MILFLVIGSRRSVFVFVLLFLLLMTYHAIYMAIRFTPMVGLMMNPYIGGQYDSNDEHLARRYKVENGLDGDDDFHKLQKVGTSSTDGDSLAGMPAWNHSFTNQPPHVESSIQASPLLVPASSSLPTVSSVPRILWMYWDQGLDHLKQLGESKKASKYQADYGCVQAWQILNPTWDIRILNGTEAMRVAPKYATLANLRNDKSEGGRTKICSVKLSDLLRLEVLSLYGGVYADTSVCPMRPLDDYLEQMVRSTGFYAPPLNFARGPSALNRRHLVAYKGCDRLGPLTASNLKDTVEARKREVLAAHSRSFSTWFIAAKPNHILIKRWMLAYYERLRQVATWSKEVCKSLPYYLPHCIFTLQRIHHQDVDEAWIQFRELVINRHNGFLQKDQGHGVCFGGSNVTAVSRNVTYSLTNCFLVKKQNSALHKFVRSHEYLQAMKAKMSS